LILDQEPPFGLYLANLNQIQMLGNPFNQEEYRDRYFEFCSCDALFARCNAADARNAIEIVNPGEP
jgi:hypothetical protein